MTINKTAVYILTLLGTLGIILMRTVQNLIMVEAGSGFFYEGYTLIATLMLIFMFGIILAAAIYGFVCPQVPCGAPRVSKIFGLASAFLAIAVLYEVFFTEISINIPLWQIVLHFALGVATTVILLLHSLSAFCKFTVPPMLDAILVLFWTVKLIIIFSNYSSLASITENIFELASLCGILLFILQFAKLQNNVTPNKTNNSFLSVSVIAFMLCAAYSVPQILLYVTGNKDLAHTSNVTFITGFAMMLFIGVYVYMCFKEENITAKFKSEKEQ